MGVVDPFALAVGERIRRRVGERQRLVLEEVAERIPEELVVARRLDPRREHASRLASGPSNHTRSCRLYAGTQRNVIAVMMPERAERQARGLVEARADVLARGTISPSAVTMRTAAIAVERLPRSGPVPCVPVPIAPLTVCDIDVALVVQREPGRA